MKLITKTLIIKIITNICRFLLATTFLFSGFVKANDPLGTVYKIEDYFSAWGIADVPELFVLLMAMGLAFLEFGIGIYLLFGMRRKWISRITLAFMSVMTLLTIYIAVANPVSDCGCFGDAIILTNEETLLKNIILLVAAIIIFKFHKMELHLMSKKVYWILSTMLGLGIIIYSIYCIYALPVIDFRPYKIGTDLRTMMDVPEEMRPQFKVTIVYEKNGQTLELDLEDDDPDSTWTYVETKREEIAHASHNIINDFYMEDGDEDVANDILSTPGYLMLLTAPNLQTADQSIIDKINDAYDYSQENLIEFYCLTASDNDERIKWTDYTGAEYIYYTSDERTLKTMIRSNPGLMLLKDGVIIAKWSSWNFPDVQKLKSLTGN